MKRISKSLKHINWRLFAALLVMGLFPTVYTTVRTFFLGQMPGDWSYSIAGQLSWVNLIYEIVNEAIILPLFFFIGKAIEDRKEFTNRLKTGLLMSLGMYSVLAIIVILLEPMLTVMAASPDIISDSATYIRIESIANIFGVLFSFSSVALISLGKDKFVYILIAVKLGLCMISDTFLVSTLLCSAKLGVNGIGYSNIIVNAFLFIIIELMLQSGKTLSKRQEIRLKTIKSVYEQQKYMYDNQTHTVENRIVSLSQPYIRPIVRGKAKAPVEFGAKLDISVANGYVRLEKQSFDAYYEATVLKEVVERYKVRNGSYPARILADKIYRNRENLAWCKEPGIRLSVPALGRPKKDAVIDRKAEYKDNCDRVEAERQFSLAKRKCGLGQIYTRLQETSQRVIALSIVALNLRKIFLAFLRRLIILCLSDFNKLEIAFVQ